jgi:hypothetical protein
MDPELARLVDEQKKQIELVNGVVGLGRSKDRLVQRYAITVRDLSVMVADEPATLRAKLTGFAERLVFDVQVQSRRLQTDLYAAPPSSEPEFSAMVGPFAQKTRDAVSALRNQRQALIAEATQQMTAHLAAIRSEIAESSSPARGDKAELAALEQVMKDIADLHSRNVVEVMASTEPQIEQLGTAIQQFGAKVMDHAGQKHGRDVRYQRFAP